MNESVRRGERRNPQGLGWFNPSMALAWIVDGTMDSVGWYWDEHFTSMMQSEEKDFQPARDLLVASLKAGELTCTAIPQNRRGEFDERRRVDHEELQHSVVQYDSDFALVLVNPNGVKFTNLLIPAYQIMRTWPGRAVIAEEHPPIEEEGRGGFSLFYATAFLARHDPCQRPAADAFDDALERLRLALNDGDVTASGIDVSGIRQSIPKGVWEMARWGYSHTEPRTHRIEFVQFGITGEPTMAGGTLTLHSRIKEKDPNWIDIRIPAEEMRALAEGRRPAIVPTEDAAAIPSSVAEPLPPLVVVPASEEPANAKDEFGTQVEEMNPAINRVATVTAQRLTGGITQGPDVTQEPPTELSLANATSEPPGELVEPILSFKTIRDRVAENGGVSKLTPTWEDTYHAIQALWPNGEIPKKRSRRYAAIWGFTKVKHEPSDSTMDDFFREFLPEIKRQNRKKS